MEKIIYFPNKFKNMADKFQKFVQMMANRISVGAFRHEEGKDILGTPLQEYIKRLKTVLKEYERTGKAEKLIDAANYAMLAYYNPLQENHNYEISDSGGRRNLNGERWA